MCKQEIADLCLLYAPSDALDACYAILAFCQSMYSMAAKEKAIPAIYCCEVSLHRLHQYYFDVVISCSSNNDDTQRKLSITEAPRLEAKTGSRLSHSIALTVGGWMSIMFHNK